MNAAELLEKAEKAKSDRKTFSVYLSESVWERFKEACGPKASRVVENLIEDFLEDLESNKKT